MPGVIIDSNILLDVITDDPKWCDWSLAQLDQLSEKHDLIINPVIYSEISISFDKIETLEKTLQNTGLVFEQIPKEALYLAGKVFVRYRRAGGRKISPLPDFYIGAHAAIKRYSLLTRDLGRYKSYFPKLQIISPQ